MAREKDDIKKDAARISGEEIRRVPEKETKQNTRRTSSKNAEQKSNGETRQESNKKLITGPTILTLTRIILVFPLMILLFINELSAQILAIIIFVLASATDFIDGRWARAKNLVTDLGAFLDPLADKMLMNLTFLGFVTLNIMPMWMFAVILVRDFAVDGMRMILAKNNVTLAANKLGKWKTTVQMITIIVVLINRMVQNNILFYTTNILFYTTIILTAISGIIYLVNGFKKLKLTIKKPRS